jgi:phage tail sheath protein FI
MATHGVTVSEVPTGVRPPVRVTAGLPIYVGLGTINAGDIACVNTPVVAYNLAEAVAKIGPISDPSEWDKWTLHEAAHAHFSVYGVGPIVLINVIDPDDAGHVASATGESHQLVDGEVQLQVYGGADAPLLGAIKSTVVVKDITGVTTYALNTDYTLAFDADGFLVVTVVAGGDIAEDDVILCDFDYLDPTGVVASDIVGGYSAGAYTGLECVEQVYPKLRLVPGFIVSPKWSQTLSVGTRMQAIAASINGSFRAMALLDLPTDPGVIATYAESAAWKSTNNYDSVNAAACWPKTKNGDYTYHLSTIVACLANSVDGDNSGIPFASPSNQSITATAAVNDDGDEILLTRPQANALNAQGIVTALNGFYGWKLWGTRTAGYPETTDPKDAFIPLRRMFNWVGNTVLLTVDRDVDQPGNRRLIDGVVGTIQSFLNGLTAQGALMPATIEFRSDENPTADLSDGIYRFHLTMTPPSPAESIEFVLEYDPTALEALFE